MPKLTVLIFWLAGALLLNAQPPASKGIPRHPTHAPAQPAERLLEQVLNPRLPAKIAPAAGDNDPNQARFFDASSLGSPLSLDQGWRVGITANPAAAQPGFDDSQWAIREAQPSFADVPFPDAPPPAGAGDWTAKKSDQPPAGAGAGQPPNGRRRPFAWFRLHIKLPPSHGRLGLMLVLPSSETSSLNMASSNLELFVNGKHVQPNGPHGDNPERYQQISRIYPLEIEPGVDSVVLAIRTPFFATGFASYTNFFAYRKLVLGNLSDLERSITSWEHRNLFERLPRLVDSTLLLVMACFMLALYFQQKGHSEYLWLALYQLVQAPIGFVDLASSAAWLDHLWDISLKAQLLLFSAYFYFEFLVTLLAMGKRWTIRLLRWSAPILLCLGPCLLLTGRETLLFTLQIGLLIYAAIWVAGWSVFTFWTLIAATLRRNYEAGLLLLPLILSLIGWIEPALTAGLSDFGNRGSVSPLTFQLGPIPFHFSSVADFAGILAILLIIFGRFLRIQRDQERAQNELAAARGVQEFLIPRQKPLTPGYEVESVFLPANEVGGDFFHVAPTDDGGLLAVLGDVAGKGLKAAMNVSMLVGALRGVDETRPAHVLSLLNRVLVGSGELTTCLAAHFSPNGELMLASAGHLSPYLNSQELTLPAALPLGVLPEAGYEESRFYLHPGDRLLILSDGVVEARLAATGELFGFERVQNLSNQSAFYIAEAATTFGQQDDITVLSVRRIQPAAQTA